MALAADHMSESSARSRGPWGKVRASLLSVFVFGVAVLALIALGVGFWFYRQMNASLAQVEGEVVLSGLKAPVRVERDRLGVPTLKGKNRLDVAFASGFVHAQDRFFQMDLLRRQASGRLSELFGSAAVKEDERARLHEFRRVAEKAWAEASDSQRSLVMAYTNGVNAGLGSLSAKPFEYVLLFAEAEPWSEVDTYLVVLTMFLGLQSDFQREASLGMMRDTLPEALFRFLVPEGTIWDAPLMGDAFVSTPVPGPNAYTLRRKTRGAVNAQRSFEHAPVGFEQTEGVVGQSNSWAVSGQLGKTGALIANELHLPLTLPNIWYRAALEWIDESGERKSVVGAMLPGTPLMVVGSNTKISWALTNALADTSDIILVETNGEKDRYRAPEGWVPFEKHRETVHVRGAEDHEFEVLQTEWGPVFGKDYQGRLEALRWVAHDHDAVNLNLVDLENAQDIYDAVDVAHKSGIPAMNFIVADAGGRIAWTIIGRLPKRVGYSGVFPVLGASEGLGWDGWLSPGDVPRVVEPQGGRLWTANNRVVEGEALARLGDGGYLLGARARQIRDRLAVRDGFTAHDMLEIQLDDQAIFLERWRELLLGLLGPDATAQDARRQDAKSLVEAWGGHASVDSAGYRIVRAFRILVARKLFDPLTSPCRSAEATFSYTQAIPQYEGPLWRLVSERPLHLLSDEYRSYDELMLAALDAALDELLHDGGALSEQTWGRRNVVRMSHPLSAAIPFLSNWLDIEPQSLPGDLYMPRVQQPTFGATLRFVVSPGREEEGFFHMPGGQSGHPFSPHYADSHGAWAHGEATAFLPTQTVSVLRLLTKE